MTFPNLAGVATKDLVENIGTGKFKASYINWSRTMNLLRENAPGWLVDYMPAEDGSLLHRAPVGAYLLIRFQNVDGSVTPALPQAVMDNRNAAIPYEKITARDITDTQRRGMCMAAAMHFGLAYELWAKLPLESGYAAPGSNDEVASAPKSQAAPAATKAAPVVASGGTSEATEATFREQLLERGVHTVAIDACVKIVVGKLGGDFTKGAAQIGGKSTEELNSKYGPTGEEEKW
jgi:hypothetical protein